RDLSFGCVSRRDAEGRRDAKKRSRRDGKGGSQFPPIRHLEFEIKDVAIVFSASLRPSAPLRETLLIPISRQRHVLELDLQRDGDHLAGRLVDELIVRGLARRVDEYVLEPELATGGPGTVEPPIMGEPRTVGALEPHLVVEEPLLIA